MDLEAALSTATAFFLSGWFFVLFVRASRHRQRTKQRPLPAFLAGFVPIVTFFGTLVLLARLGRHGLNPVLPVFNAAAAMIGAGP